MYLTGSRQCQPSLECPGFPIQQIKVSKRPEADMALPEASTALQAVGVSEPSWCRELPQCCSSPQPCPGTKAFQHSSKVICVLFLLPVHS